MNPKTTNSQTIANIFKSRKIILNLAARRNFDTTDADNFSIHEIGILYANKQLDMFLQNESGNKIYYKYHLNTKIRPANILDYVEDFYNIEEILDKNDELVIVTKDKPNDSLINTLRMEYEKDGYYINIYNLNDYLYNILDNKLVPPHRVLNNDEKKDILRKYNITDEKLLPEISRFDPPAVAIGLRPGSVTEINRSSQTSLTAKYYRLCLNEKMK